jgi:hypothetical protein
MTVQETPADRTLPCCFGNEAQVVRDMVIDTLMLPAILGRRYIQCDIVTSLYTESQGFKNTPKFIRVFLSCQIQRKGSVTAR